MMITLSALDGDPSIRHAFFTREGGVSEGVYAALNCGFGSRDDPAKVEQNRTIAAAQLGLPGERLVTCHQVHGTATVTVERVWRRAENPRADGMVTAVSGIALGVLAAVLPASPGSRRKPGHRERQCPQRVSGALPIRREHPQMVGESIVQGFLIASIILCATVPQIRFPPGRA